MERGVLAGIAAFRWATWAWLAVVLVVSDDPLRHPLAAAALAALALAWTAVATAVLRPAPELLLRPWSVTVEVAVGVALLVGDGWVYGEGHAFRASQSLGSVWPLAGVFTAAVAGGPVAGGAAGLVLGLARVTGAVVNGVDGWDGSRVLSLTSSTVLYVLAGLVGGFAASQLRRAEREISVARAREEVARTLHDGVLQTLAVVQRRATDADLVRLAHEQERELRSFLFGAVAGPDADLAVALRDEGARFEDHFGGRVEVVVADDIGRLRPEVMVALTGAVREALTNAGKHGEATRVTVYAEPDADGGVFCSVKDDGAGFDPAVAVDGQGIARSIRGRITEIDGRVEIASAPGRGTEVRLWLP